MPTGKGGQKPMEASSERVSNASRFLLVETPTAWVEAAEARVPELLIDHANCEKKAAGTALNLMFRYTAHHDLLMQLSKLAREELRHFEQVAAVLQSRGIEYANVPAARYAAGLREAVRTHEPARLIDLLIVGAIVEARSCERFEVLEPVLDDELGAFYARLAVSEARHFEVYLALAHELADGVPIEDRVTDFLAIDARLITQPDAAFGFHSGPPGSP